MKTFGPYADSGFKVRLSFPIRCRPLLPVAIIGIEKMALVTISSSIQSIQFCGKRKAIQRSRIFPFRTPGRYHQFFETAECYRPKLLDGLCCHLVSNFEFCWVKLLTKSSYHDDDIIFLMKEVLCQTVASGCALGERCSFFVAITYHVLLAVFPCAMQAFWASDFFLFEAELKIYPQAGKLFQKRTFPKQS